MNDTAPHEFIEYWDRYYDNFQQKNIPIPSQFAPFALQEASDPDLIIEYGCGTGRDSLFFARQGIKVIALDGSRAAIGKCQSLAIEYGVSHVNFECCKIDKNDLERLILKKMPNERSIKTMFYARFFLHAITDADEDVLLRHISLIARSGDVLALEFRTIRDRELKKSTEEHFRRYVNPILLFEKLLSFDFMISYAAEGFGFAKYREDDAYAARCIAIKK